MTREYKYIVSLKGERYLIYYNEIDNNGVINEVVQDIDTTPNEVEENLRQEYITLLYDALHHTDPDINHKETIEYIKKDYIKQLDKLYFSFFQHHVKYIDNIPFYINSQYLHYYNEFIKCINEQNSTIPFYFDFDNQEIHWNANNVKFNKFIEYITEIKTYIANLNKEFQEDKKWISNINPEIDFSNFIDIANERIMIENIIARQNTDKLQLIQELKKIINDFDDKLNDAWGTIINYSNPINQEFLTDLTEEDKNILQQYVEKHYNYCLELTNVQQIINGKKPNYIQTEEKLNSIIKKWSL